VAGRGGSRYPGEIWAIEAELTPKPLGRTAGIMSALLARSADYPGSRAAGPSPRYDRVIYLAAPAARGVTERATATPPPSRVQVTVCDLPQGALL
jgi:hypothetical protein